MNSICILIGFLVAMAGASTNYVLKCTTDRRYTMCTTDGHNTYCEYDGTLKTNDKENCGDDWCECKDYQEDSVLNSFQDINMVKGQLFPGDVGHVFFKQGF
ncbi:hypothetical protein F4679DRAFT_581606 [Xylaria curta]|nr:hypothetical protein F4679DRAFT_581606 [Xylaria curta]